jgi:hypothetical protein
MARNWILPVAWLSCAALLLAGTALLTQAPGVVGLADAPARGRYAAAAQWEYALSAAVVLAVFGAWYAMFRGLIGVAYRPHLAWAHLAFMAVGAGMMTIAAPVMVMAAGDAGYLELERAAQAAAVWSRGGYCVALAGFGVGALAIAEAFMRRR